MTIQRRKRSAGFTTGEIKPVETWRIFVSTNRMSFALQNFIFTEAFKFWSQVIPVCFRHDTVSPSVDIELSFFEGNFNNQ